MDIALLIVRCERHERRLVFEKIMNMLHKYHIHVVQGYKSYTCPIKFNDMYMFIPTSPVPSNSGSVEVKDGRCTWHVFCYTTSF